MMCGRYYIGDSDEEERYLSKKLRSIIDEMQRTNPEMSAQAHIGEIFPSEMAPVLVAGDGGCTVRPMRWGFPRGGGSGLVINSRSEKCDYTPMFQKAVRERRCLIPMSGFYEWRRTGSGGKTKDKFSFSLKEADEGEIMYLAGVYGEFIGGFAGGGFDGFAILTQAADQQMSPYHERMPVILRESSIKKAWLFAPPALPYSELRRQFENPRLEIQSAVQV
ncbi:MAG: SOS response-associated peptidase [Clostridiales bacterium]|nr:SOS response-associated peptidase [Clostridiales bacterium]